MHIKGIRRNYNTYPRYNIVVLTRTEFDIWKTYKIKGLITLAALIPLIIYVYSMINAALTVQLIISSLMNNNAYQLKTIGNKQINK